LTPLSFLYRNLINLRRLSFYLGIKKSTRLSVPVIIVGNITVGGTGKTPLVIYLANLLKKQGYRPGIVSRGYGAKTKNFPCAVLSESDPILVGDEPLLIAQKTQLPVAIDPNRVAAAEFLVKNKLCNIIISDDGLQHYALTRDLEIAVIDSERRFGNGFCLPSGPLREPVNRLKNIDFIVANGSAEDNEYEMKLIPETIYNLKHPQQTLNLSQHNINFHAVTAIGNPSRFLQTLRQLNLPILSEHIYPDHYLFKITDFNFTDTAPIIMTEKDAVKCRAFADERFWCLPVTAKPEEKFAQTLLQKLAVK
jgi:tetraacyldisaccharide 4'-kinase